MAAALPALSEMVAEAAAELESKCCAPARSARELSKFAMEQGAFELKFGGADAYAKGLDALVGLPSAQVLAAMAHEHCGEADAREWFTSPNYRVTTTSEIEWTFVTNPAGGLAA